VLQLLRFSHELRSPDELDVPGEETKPSKATARELEMAKQLVASMVEPWKPSQYHDEYRDDLLARIKRKAKHGEIEDAPESEKTRPERTTNVIDLVELLKKSMDKKAQGHPGAAKASEKSPHRKKGAAENGKGTGRVAAHRAHATRKAPARKTA
jgi:DNA end-binding protein Ku